MKTKVCTKCGEEKPLSEFYKSKREKDGYNYWCKSCQKEYYQENKKQLIKKSKEYNKNHPEIHILALIKYRCENPKCDHYKYYGERGIECRITADEIRKLMKRDGYWDMERPSIDRKDNNGDYTFDNCRFIELNENIKKDKYKPVLQFDLDGNFIQEHKSLLLASIETNTFSQNIYKCCVNKRQSTGGFIWKYKENKK